MSFDTLALCLAVKSQIMDIFRGIFKDVKLCCISIITPYGEYLDLEPALGGG